MSLAFKLPFVSVVEAGRVVGNGRGLDVAREDALARRVRILEVRLGRPLREPELADVEAWASRLLPEVQQEQASVQAAADASPASLPSPSSPPTSSFTQPVAQRVATGVGQVLLFPQAQPPANTAGAKPDRPGRSCAKCRAPMPPYPGLGCPRRFCLGCRPRSAKSAMEAESKREPKPAARLPRRRPRHGATGRQTLLWPELAGVCLGCEGLLAPYAGVGAPRRWCARCRPPRPHRPARSPRVGDRVRVAGAELHVVARRRLQLEGRRWRGGVEVRRPNGLLIVIPLADWRALNLEVLNG
jgi:hypothetical protein